MIITGSYCFTLPWFESLKDWEIVFQKSKFNIISFKHVTILEGLLFRDKECWTSCIITLIFPLFEKIVALHPVRIHAKVQRPESLRC